MSTEDKPSTEDDDLRDDGAAVTGAARGTGEEQEGVSTGVEGGGDGL